MSCLCIDEIYRYLEGDLSPVEIRSVQEHISFCTKCNNAVEERMLLLKASQNLPVWATPSDFTQKVMARIFPQKASLREWFATAAIGISSAVLAFFAVYLLSGQNLAHLFINLNRMALNLFRNFIVLLVKTGKLVSIVIDIILEIGSLLVKGSAILTTIISPELQIILIVLTVILSTLLLYGAKRKFFAGEKA